MSRTNGELQGMAWRIAQGASQMKPYPEERLSKEKDHLPGVVNMVCTTKLLSGMDDDDERKLNGWGINLHRVVLHGPNAKYRQRRFAAITLRLDGSVALLFESGKMVLVSALSPKHALYCSQRYRQWLENIPFLMYDDEKKESYVGTLKGQLSCRDTTVHNVVASGSLFQDGVDLSSLLDENEGKCSWVPDSFPNATYGPFELKNGTTANANISDRRAKVVIMGVTNREEVYEAYKIIKDLVSPHEDPDAPTDPRECYLYRINKLLGTDDKMKPMAKKRGRKKGAGKGKGKGKGKGRRKRKTSENESQKEEEEEEEEEGVDEDEEIYEQVVNNWASLTKSKRSTKKRKTGDEPAEDESGLMGMVMDAVDFMTAGSAPTKSGLSQEDQEKDYPLLIKAALRKQVNNVRHLLGSGADPMCKTPDGKTAIDLIGQSQDPAHKAIVQMLRQ